MTLHAYGWCVVRSSRKPYVGVSLDHAVDRLDEQTDAADIEAASRLETWLGELGEQHEFHWSIERLAWSEARVILYTASRNHRPSRLWDFHNWIVANAPGSYGLTHVHDDEDGVGSTRNGRGEYDFTNVFRVWRIMNGSIEEMDDPFFSPIYPTINPSPHC